MTGKLYIVATPIGNLEDISERALNVLREVDLILAEDTRVTRKLLIYYDIKTPLDSYHQHSKDEKKLRILSLLGEGRDIALVSDAGTPGVSDPGNELVSFLCSQGLGVQALPVPGASSVAAALSVCGFDASKFYFAGFFPKRKREKWLREADSAGVTFVYFDSPYRLIKNLEFLSESMREVEICVCRELTKIHERIYRGRVSEVIEAIKLDDPRGEVVVVCDAGRN